MRSCINRILAICLSFLGASMCFNSDRIGEMVHVTDLHLDLEYRVGAPATCVLGSTGLGCCRSYDIPNHVHYNRSRIWGEYTCDAPQSLLEGVLSWISDYHREHPVDVVLYGGDTVGHHDISQSTTKNIETIQTVNRLFQEYLPDVSVVSNQGNHDTYPIDQTPPWNRATIQSQLLKDWNKLIVEPDIANMSQPYYTWRSPEKNPLLDVVSVESLEYDSHNLFGSRERKHAQQLWLANHLQQVRQYNKGLSSRVGRRYVYLLGHIPPGGGESTMEYNSWLVPLLSNYSDIVVASFYGHSHKDQFYLYPGWRAPPALISPSLMPDARDPCLRIYRYRVSSGQLLSYRQYCLDLEATNAGNGPVMYLDYDSQEIWRDLGIDTIQDWYKNVAVESHSFQTYCQHYYGTQNGQRNADCLGNGSTLSALYQEISVSI